MLLLNNQTREVKIYVLSARGGEADTVIDMPNLPVFPRDYHPYAQLGCFSGEGKVAGSPYDIVIFDFVFLEGDDVFTYNFIRKYSKSCSSIVWNVDEFFWYGPDIRVIPIAPLMIDKLFIWVNQCNGDIFIMRNWKNPEDRFAEICCRQLKNAWTIYGINHDAEPHFVAVRRRAISIYKLNLSHIFDRGNGNNEGSVYCSRMQMGYSALGLKNGIFFGGFLGDCCCNMYAPAYAIDVEVASNIFRPENVWAPIIIQICHAREASSQPFDCTCQTAFFSVPKSVMRQLRGI